MLQSSAMWNFSEARELFDKPMFEPVTQASGVHELNHTIGEVQVSSLLSIKTDGCPEDCGYCPQTARLISEPDIDVCCRLGMRALCFLTGQSIFADEKPFTTPNSEPGRDQAMFHILGIKYMQFSKQTYSQQTPSQT